MRNYLTDINTSKFFAYSAAVAISIVGALGILFLLTPFSWPVAIALALFALIVALPLNLAIFSNAFNLGANTAERTGLAYRLGSHALTFINTLIQSCCAAIAMIAACALVGIVAKPALIISVTLAAVAAPIVYLFNLEGVQTFFNIKKSGNSISASKPSLKLYLGWYCGLLAALTSSVLSAILLIATTATVGAKLSPIGFIAGAAIGGILAVGLLYTQFIIAVKSLYEGAPKFKGDSFIDGMVAYLNCQKKIFNELCAQSNALAVGAQTYLGAKLLKKVAHSNNPIISLVMPAAIAIITVIGVYRLSKSFLSTANPATNTVNYVTIARENQQPLTTTQARENQQPLTTTQARENQQPLTTTQATAAACQQARPLTWLYRRFHSSNKPAAFSIDRLEPEYVSKPPTSEKNLAKI